MREDVSGPVPERAAAATRPAPAGSSHRSGTPHELRWTPIRTNACTSGTGGTAGDMT